MDKYDELKRFEKKQGTTYKTILKKHEILYAEIKDGLYKVDPKTHNYLKPEKDVLDKIAELKNYESIINNFIKFYNEKGYEHPITFIEIEFFHEDINRINSFSDAHFDRVYSSWKNEVKSLVNDGSVLDEVKISNIRAIEKDIYLILETRDKFGWIPTDKMKAFKPYQQSESDNVIHAQKKASKSKRQAQNKTSEERLTKLSDHTVTFIKAENSVPFVRLVSPNVKDDSLKHPYELGLYKSQSEPNTVFEMLLLFATKGKTLNPLDYPNIKMNTFSKRIERCNTWLMEKFNLKEKPILPFSKKRAGHTSLIKITYAERKKGKDSLDLTDLNYDNPDPKEDQEVNDLFSDMEEDNKFKNSYDDNFDDSDSGDYD